MARQDQGALTSRADEVEVPGGSLFVRRWQPAAPHATTPLLLLHDSLGCVALWRDFPERLAQRLQRPIIAYDRLGFGNATARHERPSFDFIREEATIYFPALREALGIGPFALFGHSVGGAMAMVIASEVSGCQAVITESAQAFVEQRTTDGIRAAQAQFDDPERFERLARWHGSRARWVLEAWTDIWLDPGFAAWSLDREALTVRCPVLALHGDQDEYGSVAFPARIVRLAQGPADTIILEGCGHVPHRERPDTVLQQVALFLDRWLPD